ncbi:MAG: hypothetical protein HN729_04550 [Candidatus Marinimicrobia bacterium]|jgi:hypothetical protein|nr:hypothetical protein [Candidatus Neomarinimicrobiota bacterium]MBT3633830.1 hypothetical protein [Candidatus Neomarinimicrobiota bacterium]MBT3682622.1 hypothetical protein [Candidatus Neomarinimicrobiota bacterium]MBT3759386.1 hypothetical protein [Candidatus Neomarinimicrobiota bacterium]MBT3894606.1 hypothetical protein [Candidatus Neomarinimicrobiota bacterium]
MEKFDHNKKLKSFYNQSKKTISYIEIPSMQFLQIDGMGDPNSSKDFSLAVEALFKLSYTLKFDVKKSDLKIDYKVMPLEGLWWSDNMNDFITENKQNWNWTLMIMQPEFITTELFDAAMTKVKEKKNSIALEKIGLAKFEEGASMQIMHMGPFSEEGPTIQKLHEHIINNQYIRIGKHHEIYLSDIRRAAPEKWRTILRQPVKKEL